jgi:hypothetical protein
MRRECCRESDGWHLNEPLVMPMISRSQMIAELGQGNLESNERQKIV